MGVRNGAHPSFSRFPAMTDAQFTSIFWTMWFGIGVLLGTAFHRLR